MTFRSEQGGIVENHSIEEPERFQPPEPACPCGCGSIWPDPCSGEGGFRMKELTLYRIDNELENLLEHRQSRLEDRADPADEEELAAIDGEIQRYMGALARKVDGVAGLLLRWKEQRDTISAERARLKALAARIESQESRLREYVALVMSRQPAPVRGPRKLRGDTSELVLRANGGPAPLLIPQPDLVPHELQTVELTIRYDLWQELLRSAPRELTGRIEADARQRVLPSNTLIRQELLKPCPACAGLGSCAGVGCMECDGTGRKSVPGAYLGERGNWIEIR
jgi:hypothetical protein